MTNKKQDFVKLCLGHNSELLQCIGTRKRDADYFVSWSKFSDGRVPYCKTCCNKIFNKFLEETNNEKISLWHTCSKLDIPLVQEVYDNLVKESSSKGIKVNISNYIKKLHSKSVNKDIWSDFSATDIDINNIDNKIKSVEDEKIELDRLEKTWGVQDDKFDYDFLEDTFQRYTDGLDLEELTPSRLDLYKDLCIGRLTLRKINDGRYCGEETIDKIQARISKIMSTLKIDQFEVKKKKSDIEKIIEKQIWEIENTEPAEVVDKNEYKDYLNIESDWGRHILRAVRNLLVGTKDYPKISKEDGTK